MRVRVYVVLVLSACIEYPETPALLVRCAVLFICEYT